jgi:hypothetical protein
VRAFLTPKWLAAHVLLIVVCATMIRLGIWQWHVGGIRHGDLRNYAYAVQWWAFTGFAIFFWARLIRDARLRDVPAPPVQQPPSPDRTSLHHAAIAGDHRLGHRSGTRDTTPTCARWTSNDREADSDVDSGSPPDRAAIWWGKIGGALLRYRVMAIVTGTALLLLVFVAIPIQIWGHNDGPCP